MRISKTYKGEFSDKDSNCSKSTTDKNTSGLLSQRSRNNGHQVNFKLSDLDPDKVFKVHIQFFQKLRIDRLRLFS